MWGIQEINVLPPCISAREHEGVTKYNYKGLKKCRAALFLSIWMEAIWITCQENTFGYPTQREAECVGVYVKRCEGGVIRGDDDVSSDLTAHSHASKGLISY